jgi:thiamine biosynthesis lipoprotein
MAGKVSAWFEQCESKMIKSTALLVCLLIAISSAPASSEELASFSGATMGTRYRVTVVGKVSTDLQAKVDSRLAKINLLMSTYDSESELSRFNQLRSADWFEVSDETAKVVEFALQVSKATHGAFDPTVGPAVNLWGFGPTGRRRKPPTTAEIAVVEELIGYEQLAVRKQPAALKKTNSEVYLDLSAVAKGYAVDEISELLSNEGCNSHLVVLGGEIRAHGSKPDNSPWKIGIEEPDQAGEPVQRSVPLVDMAVSTSGDWRNSFKHDGVRYSHVIDPATAKPVSHRLASVTVFAASSMQADAWSTALMVTGAEKGIQWCDAHDVAALFFIRGGDKTIEIRKSAAAKSL